MNFADIIYALEKKELVEVENADEYWERTFGKIIYKCKYEEVAQKINDRIDKDKFLVKCYLGDYPRVITYNKEDILSILEEATMQQGEVAEIQGDVRKDHIIAQYINEETDFTYEYYCQTSSLYNGHSAFVITDEIMRLDREGREHQEYKDALEFLATL